MTVTGITSAAPASSASIGTSVAVSAGTYLPGLETDGHATAPPTEDLAYALRARSPPAAAATGESACTARVDDGHG
jgi:hypothetical protein